MTMEFKTTLTNREKVLIEQILKKTGFFNNEEIDVAMELIDDHISKGKTSDYKFLTVHEQNNPDSLNGYACFGHIPGTHNSYDLYWIVVDPKLQNRGLGKQLLMKTEQIIAKLGGNKLYAETSSRQQYNTTRQFYLNNNFIKEATLQGFYAPSDDKIIYSKNLTEQTC